MTLLLSIAYQCCFIFWIAISRVTYVYLILLFFSTKQLVTTFIAQRSSHKARRKAGQNEQITAYECKVCKFHEITHLYSFSKKTRDQIRESKRGRPSG